MEVAGKRVLYIAPKFFGYERDIANEFRRRGANLDILLDRPFARPLMAAATRFARPAMMPFVERLYERELAAFGRSRYDLVVVVNGQTVSDRLLSRLKSSYPAAKMVLYMWDSIRNRPSAIANLKHFDKVSTFDRNDARDHAMSFRPLFFAPDFESQGTREYAHDISFIGSAHTDRAEVVYKLDEAMDPTVRRFWYLYLQAPWVYEAYRVLNPGFRSVPRSMFSFTPLPRERVHQVFANSRTILDVEHPRQTGLTIRTFEAFGAGKKLVTTNTEVAGYDFFDSHNIAVIDRHGPRIPRDFLETPYRAPDPAIYARYSIAGWLDDVLAGL